MTVANLQLHFPKDFDATRHIKINHKVILVQINDVILNVFTFLVHKRDNDDQLNNELVTNK